MGQWPTPGAPTFSGAVRRCLSLDLVRPFSSSNGSLPIHRVGLKRFVLDIPTETTVDVTVDNQPQAVDWQGCKGAAVLIKGVVILYL